MRGYRRGSFKSGSNRSMTHAVSSPSEVSAIHVFWRSEKINKEEREREEGNLILPKLDKMKQKSTKKFGKVGRTGEICKEIIPT